MAKNDFIIVTSNYVPGFEVTKSLGDCVGVIVRSRGIGGNILASLRTIVGGEIHEYTKMLYQSRIDSISRMKEQAKQMGANAIISMRFDSSEIGETMSEIVAYGTAVVIRKSGRKGSPVSLQ